MFRKVYGRSYKLSTVCGVAAGVSIVSSPKVMVLFTNTRGSQIQLSEGGWRELQGQTNSILQNFVTKQLPMCKHNLDGGIALQFIEINFRRALRMFCSDNENDPGISIMEQTFRNLTHVYDCIDNVINQSHQKVGMVRAKFITYTELLDGTEDEVTARANIRADKVYDSDSIFDCEILALGLQEILTLSKKMNLNK